MTEPPDAPRDVPGDTPGPEIAAAGESSAAASGRPAASGYRAVAIGLAGALLLVVALVATAPFWAPALPWGPAPAPALIDAALGPRLDRLDAAQQQDEQRRQQEDAAAKSTLQRLDRRVDALEARPAAPPGDIAEMRQQAAKLVDAVADLGLRVAAIDQAVQARKAADMTDTALVLALLQIRGAVAAGRPFAAEYEALSALGRARPEIAAAAAPLAEPAKTGVAGRAVLANRLRQLAGTIAAAKAPANPVANGEGAASDWASQALRRLGGLVTIRRLDDAGQHQPGGDAEAAVNDAELALSGGDLDGAVAALDRLSGAPAEAARPWLRMAKERLAVEAALQRIEALLVARLGAPANAPAGPGSPR